MHEDRDATFFNSGVPRQEALAGILLASFVHPTLLHIVRSSHLEPAHGLAVQEASCILDHNSIAKIAFLLIILSLQVLEILRHVKEIEFEVWREKD